MGRASAKLSEAHLARYKAMLARETFTYGDIAVLTDESVGTIRTFVHRLQKRYPELFVHMGRRQQGGAGRRMDLWRLTEEARDWMIRCIALTEGPGAPAPQAKAIERSVLLDDAKALLAETHGSDAVLSVRHRNLMEAERLLQRLGTSVERWRNDPAFTIMPNFLTAYHIVVGQVATATAMLDSQLAETWKAAQWNIDNPVPLPRFEECGAENVGRRQPETFLPAIMRPNSTGYDGSRPSRAAIHAMCGALEETMARAQANADWRRLSEDVVVRTCRSPLLIDDEFRHAFGNAVEDAGFDPETREQVADTRLAYSPMGEGRGLASEEGMDAVLRTLEAP